MVEEAAAADVAPASRATVAIGGRMGAEQYSGNIIKACICVIGIVPPNYKICRLSFHATIPRAVCKEEKKIQQQFNLVFPQFHMMSVVQEEKHFCKYLPCSG